MSWATCSECGETFGSDSGFVGHQIKTTGQPGWDASYDWRCATADELRAKGWFQDARGWWRMPVRGAGPAARGKGRSGPDEATRPDFQPQGGSLGQGAA